MKNAKLENKTTVVKREWILWIMMGIVLLLSIYTNHYFSHQVIAIRLIGWIIAILILASLFFYTAIGRQFWVFAQASRAELRKVVWPTREETVRTTLIVIVMVIVAGLFLWAIDTLLLWAVAFLTA
ncbi:preprotein translocase subunit SecE [Rickettsiella grylli]|nr:preprotein translocase subunit SecE [Rickettsiella grylli]